jgi:DNA-directed RNA polymerase specialized sigma24 family protein
MNNSQVTMNVYEIIEIGTKVALDKFEEMKKDRVINRYDKRLRNTKKLLENYKTLVLHSGEAIFSKKQSVIDILDQLDFETEDEDMYIESIKKSTERTALIIAHIKKMLKILQILDDNKSYKDRPTRYEVLKFLYIDEKNKTQEEIAEIFETSSKTVQRRKEDAIEELSGLVFGIDGLKMR